MTMQGQHDLPRILANVDQNGRDHTRESYNLKLFTEKPTYILWIVSSWTICFLNLVFVVLTIRDMWTNGYTAGTHGLSVAIITSTIFGLMLIHEKIIRK